MNPAASNSRWPEVLYLVLAVVGLVGTNAQLPAYLPEGFVAGTLHFWKDSLVTPAGVFLVVDLFVLGTAVFVWMFGECRRLGIAPWMAWVYLLGSLLIGISCFVPLFMAHRQRRLRALHPEQQVNAAGSDFIGIALALALVAAAFAYSLCHIPQ